MSVRVLTAPDPTRFDRPAPPELDLRLLLLGRARAGWARASSLECSRHDEPMRRLGFTDEQIDAVAARSVTWCWSALQLAVLRLADAVVLDRGRVPDHVADVLNEHFDDAEVLGLALAIASFE